MPNPTDSCDVLAHTIYDLFVTNKVALGLQLVFYGDQQKIPHTPTVCVEPGNHSSRYNGVGMQGRILNTFEVYILVYSLKLVNPDSNLEISDDLAYRARTLLHADVKFGGLVHRSFVREVQPGYVRRPALMRASRLTLEAESQTFL